MTFRRYATERTAVTLLVLFFAVSFAYLCFHVWTPAPRARPAGSTAQYIARYHHFQRESYGDFLWQLVGHGSLDRDIETGRDLTVPMLRLAARTFSLAEGAVVFGLLVGVPLGLAWTRWPRIVRFVGAPVSHLSLALWSLALSLWLLYLLAYRTELLAPGGYCDFFGTATAERCGGPGDWSYHLALPWMVLGLPLVAVYSGVIRRLAVGISRAADTGAALRGAAVTFVKLVARNLFWFVGAALFVEVIFSIRGLDASFVFAAFSAGNDPPFGEAILIITTLLTVGAWLVVDLVGAALSRAWRMS
jgi:ABC-type dipeptide/oligopeptide/nickel transport system permease component